MEIFGAYFRNSTHRGAEVSKDSDNSNVTQVEDLDATVRGEGGFGSTGYHGNNLQNSEKPAVNGKRGNLECEENQVKKLNVSGSWALIGSNSVTFMLVKLFAVSILTIFNLELKISFYL